MHYESHYHEWAAIRPMLPDKPRRVPRVGQAGSGVATRYGKLAANYLAFIQLGSIAPS
jgi:transposase